MERSISVNWGEIIHGLRIFSGNLLRFVETTYVGRLLNSWKIIAWTMEI